MKVDEDAWWPWSHSLNGAHRFGIMASPFGGRARLVRARGWGSAAVGAAWVQKTIAKNHIHGVVSSAVLAKVPIQLDGKEAKLNKGRPATEMDHEPERGHTRLESDRQQHGTTLEL